MTTNENANLTITLGTLALSLTGPSGLPNRKISAIKIMRNVARSAGHDLGLKEAKDLIDAAAVENDRLMRVENDRLWTALHAATEVRDHTLATSLLRKIQES